MKYLIWSFEHDMWWRPDSAGYTTKVAEAGRYTADMAVTILCNCSPGEEVPVREDMAADDAWPAKRRQVAS